ncbi:serine/threonine-protein kinase, partial [Frankia sp. CpI1-P]
QHDPLREDDPRQIGPYTLLERIGAGGMGVVYLARDSVGRRVALKIPGSLGRDHPIPQAYERFVAEVATHRTLTSERVVRFLDADVTGRPPWVALEYVQGANLGQVVAQAGVFRDRFLLALAAELAEAVADIHAHGIVHRDLHPANVICLPNGIKVIDFGLARVQADDESLTTQGPPIGVPAFMAPERFTGVVTRACDVFAWGCCVAYAAAGTPPFPTATPHDAYAAVADSPPVLTNLPGDLADLVGWALAKRPADRPTASRLAAELQELGVPVTRPAVRPWPAQALPLISRAVPATATRAADDWISGPRGGIAYSGIGGLGIEESRTGDSDLVTTPSSPGHSNHLNHPNHLNHGEPAPIGPRGAGGMLGAVIGAALCLLGLALAAGGYPAGDVTGPGGAGLVAAAVGVLAFVRTGDRSGDRSGDRTGDRTGRVTPVAPVGAQAPRPPGGITAWFVSVTVIAGGVAGGVLGLFLARELWAGSPRAAAASELALACCFAAAFALYLRGPAAARPEPTR